MSHSVLELSQGTSASQLEIMKEVSKTVLEMKLNWCTNCERAFVLISTCDQKKHINIFPYLFIPIYFGKQDYQKT